LFNLKKFAEEAVAQVTPSFIDHGKTAATVRAARPAPPAPAKIPSPNFKPAPSIGQRLTHNPLTNFVGKDLVKPIITTGEKSLNTLGAGAVGVGGGINTAIQSVAGTDQSYQHALDQTQRSVDNLLSHGIGNKGAYLTPQQATSSGDGFSGLKQNFLKPVAQGVTDIAPLVAPVGAIGQEGKLLYKAGTQGLANAAVGSGTDASQQLLDSGHINVAQNLKAAGLAGTVGAAFPVAGAGARVVADGVTTKLVPQVNNAMAVRTEAGAVGKNVLEPENKPTTSLVPPPAAPKLQDKPDLYFNMDKKHEMANVKDMVSGKTPEQNAKAATNAEKLMTQASKGGTQKRDPILVHKAEDGKYHVLDGNATTTTAQKHGFKQLPVHVVDSKIKPEAQHVEAVKAHIKNAEKDNQELQDLIKNVASEHGGNAIEGPVKKIHRTLKKTMDDYKGDHNRMKDIIRGTIETPDNTPANIKKIVDNIEAKHGKAFEIKNVEHTPNHDGYTDTKVIIETKNGVKGEIIIASPEMLKAKNGPGHKLYEIANSKGSKYTKEDKEKALAQMQKLYSGAQEAANKRLASAGDLSKSETSRLTASASDISRERSTRPNGAGAPVKATKPSNEPSGSSTSLSTTSSSKKNFVDINDVPSTNTVSQFSQKSKRKPNTEDNNRFTLGGKQGRQNIGPETQEAISGRHDTRSTKDLKENAETEAGKLSNDDLIAQAHDRMAVKVGKIDDKDVAFAQQAIERADEAGRFDDASGIHDALSEHLVKNGQTIQAASLFYRRSPQGMYHKALRDLKKTGVNLTDDIKKELKAKTNAIKAAKGTPAKQRATAEFQKYVSDNIPKSKLQGALAVWKAGLLSGVKTHGGNVVSNTTFHGLKTASNPMAAAIDKAFSLGTKTRTKTFTTKGNISGTKEGLGKAKDTLKTGIDDREILGNKYEIHGELNFKNKHIQRAFGKTSNGIFRALKAADQPTYYANFKNTLYDLAKADGLNKGLKGQELKFHVNKLVKDPPKEMANTAQFAAEKSTLMQDTKLTRALGGFTQKIPAAQVLVPFVKVPTNFLTRSIDYTPVGAIKTVVKQIRAKKFDQRAMSEALGEATTGSALIYLGAELANSNLLSGQFPRNDQKETARWKAEGIKANSIKVGNTWFSLNYLGPAGILLGAGKDFHDAAKRGESGTMGAIVGAGKNLTGQSFLTGFSGFADALNNPERSAKSFINSEAGSIVPTLSADLANFGDKMQRDANTAKDTIASRIPGARNSLPVKQSVYGQELKQPANKFNQLLNPVKPSQQIDDSVLSEVRRLHQVDPNNGDLQVTPTAQDKSIQLDGKDVKLNQKQQYDLQKQIGQATKTEWNKIISDSKYSTLSDIDKANTLSKARQDIGSAVKDSFARANSLGGGGKLTKKAKQLLRGDEVNWFDRESKLSGDSTKSASKTTGGSSSKDTTYLDKYNTAKDEFDKNSKDWSGVQRIKKQKELNRLAVAKDYSEDTVSLYGMGKNEVYNLVTTDPNGKQYVADLLKYGDALVNAGITDTNKFRNKYGSEAIAPSKKRGTKGSTGSRGGSRGRTNFSLYSGSSAKNPIAYDKSLRSLLKQAHVKNSRKLATHVPKGKVKLA
jgi:hypothetical protein